MQQAPSRRDSLAVSAAGSVDQHTTFDIERDAQQVFSSDFFLDPPLFQVRPESGQAIPGTEVLSTSSPWPELLRGGLSAQRAGDHLGLRNVWRDALPPSGLHDDGGRKGSSSSDVWRRQLSEIWEREISLGAESWRSPFVPPDSAQAARGRRSTGAGGKGKGKDKDKGKKGKDARLTADSLRAQLRALAASEAEAASQWRERARDCLAALWQWQRFVWSWGASALAQWARRAALAHRAQQLAGSRLLDARSRALEAALRRCADGTPPPELERLARVEARLAADAGVAALRQEVAAAEEAAEALLPRVRDAMLQAAEEVAPGTRTRALQALLAAPALLSSAFFPPQPALQHDFGDLLRDVRFREGRALRGLRARLLDPQAEWDPESVALTVEALADQLAQTHAVDETRRPPLTLLVARAVFPPLFAPLWAKAAPGNAQKDAEYRRRARALREAKGGPERALQVPEKFLRPAEYATSRPYARASAALETMALLTVPTDMLDATYRAVQAVEEEARARAQCSELTADDMMPILQLALVNSRLLTPCHVIAYIENFAHPEERQYGVFAYSLTTASACLNSIFEIEL